VKLGKNHKLRRKRRALAGIVERLRNNTNKRQHGHHSRSPPAQLGDSIQEFMTKANVSRDRVANDEDRQASLHSAQRSDTSHPDVRISAVRPHPRH
jgi:hypothetical protein